VTKAETSIAIVISIERISLYLQPSAVDTIHGILSTSPLIPDVRWHFKLDFDKGSAIPANGFIDEARQASPVCFFGDLSDNGRGLSCSPTKNRTGKDCRPCADFLLFCRYQRCRNNDASSGLDRTEKGIHNNRELISEGIVVSV
jgi:hypothetical protein